MKNREQGIGFSRRQTHAGGVTQTPDGAVEQLLKVLEKLPFVSTLKRDVQSLRSILYERRAPRIAIIGRQGSGRTRVGNALLGKEALPIDRPVGQDEWVRVDAHGSRLDWLELAPLAGADEAMREERLSRALSEARPDVVLLAVTASDLVEEASAVLDLAGSVSGRIESRGSERPVVVALLTRADEVPPMGSDDVPWPEEKSQAVDLLRQRLEKAVGERDLEAKAVLSIATGDAEIGIDALTDAIYGELPKEAQLEGARALCRAHEARRSLANEIVHSCSTMALTIGLAPVPLSDAFVIAPLQVVMVSAVAHLGGRPWDQKAAVEWMGSMGVVGGAGMGFRWTAQQLVKLVPGAGYLVSAGVAGAGTATLGQSAIAYFLREGPHELRA